MGKARVYGFSPEQMKSYEEHIDWSKQALATFGDPNLMPVAVRDRWDKILDAFAFTKPPEATPQQPQARPYAGLGYGGVSGARGS